MGQVKGGAEDCSTNGSELNGAGSLFCSTPGFPTTPEYSSDASLVHLLTREHSVCLVVYVDVDIFV